MGLIYWFFFGKNDEIVAVEDSVDILVDGGYKPENIKIAKGKTTRLVFKRTDPNNCLEEIYIPDFKIKKYLPLNQKVEIDLAPGKAGVYQTHCGMGMFHGKIIVN
ncbi:MAG: Cupredoxin family domain protein [Candidatus Woesebacteria bacterium GW2011_GWB1_39_10]|nr:MAG: Cupredoxin family domain protein [Candidatus Woesebacteria bacterium GW2011_GWB1_39_10]KKR92292.1 MAG: Cupredoxin family domain protein [Candidatus Woesebacteria bacterium GW2011_GWA1_41_13b]